MDLHEASSQIALIHEQMARGEVFRGYRSRAVALSGGLAVLAALIQPLWAPAPVDQLPRYLGLWLSVAVVSVCIAAIALVANSAHDATRLAREKAMLAIELFVPSLIAGGLLTVVIVATAREAAWMLPGLWAMCFSLGVFASQRCLTRAVFWVGVFYLAAGAVVLCLARGESALAPWTMGAAFGGGQLFAAAVLYWRLERLDG